MIDSLFFMTPKETCVFSKETYILMIGSLLFMTPKESYMFSKEIYKLTIDSQLRHEQNQDTNFLAK